MKTFKQLYTEKAPNTADAMKAGFTDKAHLKLVKQGLQTKHIHFDTEYYKPINLDIGRLSFAIRWLS